MGLLTTEPRRCGVIKRDYPDIENVVELRMTVRKINPTVNLMYLIWLMQIAMPLGAYSIIRLYPHTRFAIRKNN
jgi:hypothetical protein